VLTKLGFEDFVIRLNDRRALNALLECAGVPPALQSDALVAIDKLDKIGVDGVRRELTARGIDADATTKCLEFFSGGSIEDPRKVGALDRLREFVKSHHAGPPAVSALDEIVQLTDGTPAHGHIHVDPSLARGLSYYTGAIMEIAVSDLAGSLGGGGRYDNLIGMFLGRDVPACGFSLGLERLIVVMTERNMFPPAVARGGVDILVTIWNADARGDALALAGDLRRAGLRVDVYPEADKLGKQFKYASSRSVPFVAVVGDDERERGEVAIKDMRSGEQQAVLRADAGAEVVRRLR
jgi:histidyl-tRNA synthetase